MCKHSRECAFYIGFATSLWLCTRELWSLELSFSNPLGFGKEGSRLLNVGRGFWRISFSWHMGWPFHTVLYYLYAVIWGAIPYCVKWTIWSSQKDWETFYPFPVSPAFSGLPFALSSVFNFRNGGYGRYRKIQIWFLCKVGLYCVLAGYRNSLEWFIVLWTTWEIGIYVCLKISSFHIFMSVIYSIFKNQRSLVLVFLRTQPNIGK